MVCEIVIDIIDMMVINANKIIHLHSTCSTSKYLARILIEYDAYLFMVTNQEKYFHILLE